MSTLADLRAKNLREQGKLPQPAPVTTIEKPDEASIKLVNQLTGKPDDQLTGLSVNQLTSYTPAKNGKLLALEELDDCALPQSDKAVRQFLVDATRYPRTTIGFKGSRAWDILIARFLRDHWKDGNQKQDLLTRGIMLVLYEKYTGKQLVDFDAE